MRSIPENLRPLAKTGVAKSLTVTLPLVKRSLAKLRTSSARRFRFVRNAVTATDRKAMKAIDRNRQTVARFRSHTDTLAKAGARSHERPFERDPPNRSLGRNFERSVRVCNDAITS